MGEGSSYNNMPISHQLRAPLRQWELAFLRSDAKENGEERTDLAARSHQRTQVIMLVMPPNLWAKQCSVAGLQGLQAMVKDAARAVLLLPVATGAPHPARLWPRHQETGWLGWAWWKDQMWDIAQVHTQHDPDLTSVLSISQGPPRFT